jgi:hypothetical protein
MSVYYQLLNLDETNPPTTEGPIIDAYKKALSQTTDISKIRKINKAFEYLLNNINYENMLSVYDPFINFDPFSQLFSKLPKLEKFLGSTDEKTKLKGILKNTRKEYHTSTTIKDNKKCTTIKIIEQDGNNPPIVKESTKCVPLTDDKSNKFIRYKLNV